MALRSVDIKYYVLALLANYAFIENVVFVSQDCKQDNKVYILKKLSAK